MKFIIKELKAKLHLPDELIERGYKPRKGAKYMPEKNQAYIELNSAIEHSSYSIIINYGAKLNLRTGNELLSVNYMLEKKHTPESEFDVYSEILPIWNGCFYSSHQINYGKCVTVRYLEFYKEKMWVMFCLSSIFDTVEECISALKHIIDSTEIEIKD